MTARRPFLRRAAGWLGRRLTAYAMPSSYRRPAAGADAFDRSVQPEAGADVLVILSGIPIDDTGGGARCTQIAREALRQGDAVIFVNRFPKHESVELRLRLDHPRLLSGPLSELDLDRFVERHRDLLTRRSVGVLVEFAVPEFLPLIQRLRALGAVVVYDLLDDWDSALGAAWYRPETEREVVESASVLVASAPVLVERLQRLSGRKVELLPNAVNQALFDPGREHARPSDLPAAEWTVLYFGALWGDWFDWDLLVECARRLPSASFVLIGDYRGQCPALLDNVHFPGLKAQDELPAYLAHADVTFVPWKVNPVTQATSPIKVYEYLSMRRPVVAPWLPALDGMPFVLRARDTDEFVAHLEAARAIKPQGPELDAFVSANSWTERVRRLRERVRARSERRAAAADDSGTCRVTFSPSGIGVDVPAGVLALAEEHATPMLDGNELLSLAAALAMCPPGPDGHGLVVEIGAFEGRTSVFMAKVLRILGRRATILSIDPFERTVGDALNPPGSYTVYRDHVQREGLDAICLPLVAQSHDAAAAVAEGISVLIVDGDHHYESVRADLRLYGPKVRPGGLIFVDDYSSVYAEVQRATDEFFDGNAGFEVLHKSYFVIARRRPTLPV